jgi:hypothetical protein
MEEQKELFGKLFNSIPLYDEEHLETLLYTMNKDTSVYYLIQAIKYGYESGIYSMGECEVISKAIRVISKKEEDKKEV